MNKEIKIRINPDKRANYISASRKYKRNKDTLKIDDSPIMITQLQIDLGVEMFQKDAEYFVNLIKENKNRKVELQITFKDE